MASSLKDIYIWIIAIGIFFAELFTMITSISVFVVNNYSYAITLAFLYLALYVYLFNTKDGVITFVLGSMLTFLLSIGCTYNFAMIFNIKVWISTIIHLPMLITSLILLFCSLYYLIEEK